MEKKIIIIITHQNDGKEAKKKNVRKAQSEKCKKETPKYQNEGDTERYGEGGNERDS